MYLRTGLVLSAALLLSCSSDSVDLSDQDPDAGNCTIAEQNQAVHEVMQDYYYWYQEIPESIDYTSFDSPEATLEYLRYTEKDRFSYITDAETFDQLYNQGAYVGYGFSYRIEDDERVRFRYIFSSAPAADAGLERGEEILSVNGESVSEIISRDGWSDVFGDNEVGYPVAMQVRKNDGSIVDVDMQKETISINTVLHHSVIEYDGITYGYLVYQSFNSVSLSEFATVFADFKAAGVDKVILDLRYNGGGSVSVANTLGSYLDSAHTDQVFTRLEYNDKLSNYDQSYLLKTISNELSADELIAITSASTCSASEMVINGMAPFMSVKTVGSVTCGKPIGMNPFEFCDKVILPITFTVVNGVGEGDYFDGLAVDCGAEDDLDYVFGDEEDPMLAEALHVGATGSCSAAGSRASRIPADSPKPDDYKNWFGAV